MNGWMWLGGVIAIAGVLAGRVLRVRSLYALAVLGLVLVGTGVYRQWIEPSPERDGLVVMVDTSCDAPRLTQAQLEEIAARIATAVQSGDAVAIEFFGANSSRRPYVDITDAPPEDTVEREEWIEQRIEFVNTKLPALQTMRCRQVGTSIVGAITSADEILDGASVAGERRIVLVTNGIEHSDLYVVNPDTFTEEEVPRVIAAIDRLPDGRRPDLAEDTTLEAILIPVENVQGTDRELSEPVTRAIKSMLEEIGPAVGADPIKVSIAAISRPSEARATPAP